jgi:hypothetical protein
MHPFQLAAMGAEELVAQLAAGSEVDAFLSVDGEDARRAPAGIGVGGWWTFGLRLRR